MKRSPARSRRAAPLRAIRLVVTGSTLLLLAACATSDPTIAGAPSVPFRERDASELSEPPVPRIRVPPSYPLELRDKGITGEAIVEFIVTKTGHVMDAHAIRATHREFGIAAENAISQWKYRPGKKDGQPVNCRLQQHLAFDIVTD